MRRPVIAEGPDKVLAHVEDLFDQLLESVPGGEAAVWESASVFLARSSSRRTTGIAADHAWLGRL